MANTKISQLPDASLPLSGTEQIPVVQTGVTVKTTVADMYAGSDAASFVGYQPAGTGAVATTVQTKLREFVSRADYDSDANYNTARNALTGRADHRVRAENGTADRLLSARLADVTSIADFGASPSASASTNDAAFAAAFAYLGTAGGEVLIPRGQYNVSATISPPFNVSLKGAGVQATLLRQNTLNIPVISLTGGQCHIKDLGVIYAGTPASGADAILVSNADNYIHNVYVFNGWNGIRYTAGGQKANSISVKDCINTGIFVNGANDVYVSDFLITTATASNFANGGICLENRAEAMLFCNGSVLGGSYSIVTGASVYDFNVRPAFCRFTSVYFDAAANGSLLNQLFVSKFVGCWFSGGRSGGGSPGMTLGQSNNVTFESCEFFNSGSHGALVNANAVGAAFHQCLFADNGTNVAANGARGLLFLADTNDFIVQGCRATNGLYPNADQGFGIVVDTGTSDRYIIADNLVSGNALGGVFDGGSGANKRVANNY